MRSEKNRRLNYMLTIITNPIILSVIILVALCLLKVNVFLAIILSSLICAVLGGASVTEGLDHVL